MWLTNLRVVLPDAVLAHGAILVDGAQIAAVLEGDPPPDDGRPWLDGGGLTALPGLVDMHGDMLERELEPRPGVHFPTAMAIYELDKRLAASGVTTAYASISFWDVESPAHAQRLRELVEALGRMRPELLVDQLIHARYEVSSPVSASLLAELLRERRIQLLSLMDHTPGQGQYRDIEHYVSFMARFRGTDRATVAAEVEQRMLRGLDGTAANWEAARQITELAREQGLTIASHDDDTPAKVELVAQLGATISEFPVTLVAAEAARAHGMHVVMGAPNALRGGSHAGNLSALDAVAAGVVDMLAADYSPAAMLQAVFLLERRGLALHAASRLVSQHPADALGLHDRGRLAAGLLADIALVEAGPTPRVRAVLRGGRPIYWDGSLALPRS